MAQCKDCKFYKPIDDSKGDCFGHEVPATLDTANCPANAFQPREQTNPIKYGDLGASESRF